MAVSFKIWVFVRSAAVIALRSCASVLIFILAMPQTSTENSFCTVCVSERSNSAACRLLKLVLMAFMSASSLLALVCRALAITSALVMKICASCAFFCVACKASWYSELAEAICACSAAWSSCAEASLILLTIDVRSSRFEFSLFSCLIVAI